MREGVPSSDLSSLIHTRSLPLLTRSCSATVQFSAEPGGVANTAATSKPEPSFRSTFQAPVRPEYLNSWPSKPRTCGSPQIRAQGCVDCDTSRSLRLLPVLLEPNADGEPVEFLEVERSAAGGGELLLRPGEGDGGVFSVAGGDLLP